MINLQKLITTHILSENIDTLKAYFDDKPLNFGNPIIRQFFAKFVEQEDNYNILLDLTGEFVDLDEVSENSNVAEDIFNKLPKDKQDEFHNFYVNHKAVDPVIEPSYKFITVKKELPPNTLLVRFVGGGQFNAVKQSGFELGLNDMDKLHATEYYDRSFKENGGYIFAYIADSPEAKKQAKASEVGSSYGQNCIFFKHSGLLVYHKLDGEEQVITYGLDIQPDNAIFAKGSDEGKFIITNGGFDRTPKTYAEILKVVKNI